MISISPNTADLYLDPSNSLHDELVKEGISDEEFSKANEEFEDIINSFLTAAEDAGFSYFSNCGQIFFEKGKKFQFMLTNYI